MSDVEEYPSEMGFGGEPIRYGDIVSFYLFDEALSINPKNGRLRTGDDPPEKFCLKHFSDDSNKEVILGGSSLRIVGPDNCLCRVGKDNVVYCKSDVEGTSVIRILDKHGADKVELVDGHYVKFRVPGNGIDLSSIPGKQPLALVKQNWRYYGFIMRKV